jgi:uroporphyrinogen decarboxylase
MYFTIDISQPDIVFPLMDLSVEADALGLYTLETGVDIGAIVRKVPASTIVMGNISPTRVLLRGNETDVCREVDELLDEVRGVSNFILSTGCDLPTETPDANTDAFFRAAREY